MTVFQGSKLSLIQHMTLFYLFSLDVQPFIVEKMVPDVSHTTILKIYESYRRKCSEKLWSGDVIGEEAESSIVELDESYFGKKRKYNRGRIQKRVWVFGLVERQTNKVLLKTVPNRKKETLLPLITAHVSKQATIYHDDFATYRHLETIGYKHGTVNHSREFKSKDGVCTNKIEGVWGLVKTRICSMHGIRHEHLQEILDDFAYRYGKHTIFQKLVHDIAVPA